MPRNFGTPTEIVPAVTTGRVAASYIEIFLPVHPMAGQATSFVEIVDENGIAPGDGVGYIRTVETVVDETWNSLDPIPANRKVKGIFVDENGERYPFDVLITDLIEGEGSSLVQDAHLAVKALIYSNTVLEAAGLPTAGVTE